MRIQAAPDAAYSPSGYFIYDNQLFPAINPSLDTDGLLFTGNGCEVNIWGNGAGQGSYYTFYESNGFNVNGTDTVAQTPEPTTLIVWSLLGGLGMAIGCWRRKAA